MATLQIYSAVEGLVTASLNYNAATHALQSVTVVNSSPSPFTFAITKDGGGTASHTFNAGTTTFNVPNPLGLTLDPTVDTDLLPACNWTIGCKWP